jgi:citrate synthase
MLFGKEPDADETRLMDIDAIVHAEHGSNASSFAARVAAGTLADLHSAIVAGISTLKGPLHGGAAEKVMDMAQAIGTPDKAEEYVKNILDQGGKIMGFGHAVYRALDPRSVHMREGCQALSEKIGQPQWFQILSKVEDAMRPYREKGIYPNVDFWSGATYHLMKIPEDLFIPIFAMSRIAGWTLQVLEQLADNRLIRPLLYYEGPMDLAYVPIEQR